jgi:hypothetical protein
LVCILICPTLIFSNSSETSTKINFSGLNIPSYFMLKYQITKTEIIGLFLASSIFIFSQQDNFFFWDNIVQLSIPANWYFDNNFKYFFLPDTVATGHPTFVGMYLAFAWQLFGKSIAVSHWALGPFVFGAYYQLFKLISTITKKRSHLYIIFLFVVLDATLLSQLSLISFDILHIFFFLWSTNSIIREKPLMLSFAFLGLCLVSLRGAMSGAGIILFFIFYRVLILKRFQIKHLKSFLPGVLGLVIFLVTFYLNKHWIVHNTVYDDYAPLGTLFIALKNLAVFGYWLIDFGRIGIWLVFSYILYFAFKTRSLIDKKFKILIFITLGQFLIFFPIILMYDNPFGHRYFLPIIIPVTIATIYWVLNYGQYPKYILSFVMAIVISGYFWIYPLKIAQGWDSTPAHWPYYKIQNEMVNFIKSNHLPLTQIGTSFPNFFPLKVINLTDEENGFKKRDIQSDEYILYSNVFNESDELIDELLLSGNWREIKRIEKYQIYMVLFEKK